MKNRQKYALLLLEKYRALSGCTARTAYQRFQKHRIFDYIEDTFAAIHTEDLDLVTGQIAGLIKKGITS